MFVAFIRRDLPAPGPLGSRIPRREKRAGEETALTSSPAPRQGHSFGSSMALGAFSVVFPKINSVAVPSPRVP